MGGVGGEGLPPTPSTPDGKLRAIGHMSKAMTGGKGLREARGSLLCWGRQGPGKREGSSGSRKLQLGPGTLKPAEPIGPRESSVAAAKSPGGISVG